MALINTLRNKMGTIVIVVIALSMFAFILTDLLQSNSRLFGPSNEVGEIAGNTISIEEYQAEVDEVAYNFALNTGRNPLADEMELIRQQAWQSLIVKFVFEKEAEKAGIAVTDAEVVDMVQGNNINPQIRQFFTDPNTGEFSRQNVINFLRQINNAPPQQRQSWLAFEQTLAPSRKLGKYENLLEMSRFANKYEAKQEYMETGTADVNYFYVPFFSVPDSVIEVSESELKEYISDHADEYERDASIDLSYVTFAITPSPADTAFVEEEIEQLREGLSNAQDDSTFVMINSDSDMPFNTFHRGEIPEVLIDENGEVMPQGTVSDYQLVGNRFVFYKISEVFEGDEHFLKASHILFQTDEDTEAARAEAKAEAQRVLREIRGGADFAEMAQEYGTDGTASRGGDLGWFGEESSFVQEFKDAAFGYNGTGLLREVVETDFGYHIIKITEPKTNVQYKVASIAKEIFASDETLNEAYREADIFAAGVERSQDFIAQAEEKGYRVLNAANINKNDKRIGGLTKARSIVFWGFNDASVGDVSDVFELEDQYVVAAKTGEQEEGLASVAQVRNEVNRKVMNQKKAEIIIEELNGLSGTYEEMKEAYTRNSRTGNAQFELGDNSISGIGFAPEAVGTAFSMNEGETTRPFQVTSGIIMLTLNSKQVPTELESYDAYRDVVLNSRSSIRRREEPRILQKIYQAVTDVREVKDYRYRFY
jgi:peptidyl-prolyl cis-trans isomerase D